MDTPKSKRTSAEMSSRLRRFIERRFPDNAFDRPADREVVLNRIEGALKFRGVLDQFVGSMLLAGIAGMGGGHLAGPLQARRKSGCHS